MASKKLPMNRPLTNIDLEKYTKHLPYFRGIFMRDKLPTYINKNKECGIVNLDDDRGNGTHWVAYIKNNKIVIYFDSYGNLKPPNELINYFGSRGYVKIFYNYERKQSYNSFNCGQLCLEFLYKQSL